MRWLETRRRSTPSPGIECPHRSAMFGSGPIRDSHARMPNPAISCAPKSNRSRPRLPQLLAGRPCAIRPPTALAPYQGTEHAFHDLYQRIRDFPPQRVSNAGFIAFFIDAVFMVQRTAPGQNRRPGANPSFVCYAGSSGRQRWECRLTAQERPRLRGSQNYRS